MKKMEIGNHRILIILLLFFQSSVANKIFFSSIPKSGTHMLTKCIQLLTNKKAVPSPNFYETGSLPEINFENQFATWHTPYHEKITKILDEEKFKYFFIYRDPRDLIISYIFFNIKYIEQIPLEQNEKLYLLDFNDLLMKSIENIKMFYDCYIPWTKNNNCLAVKFEDLVGSKGGGNDELQILIIKKICEHLEVEYNDSIIENCAKELFGGTGTFREGKIGAWKKYFKEHHKALFKQIAGKMLIDLGYEKDLNW